MNFEDFADNLEDLLKQGDDIIEHDKDCLEAILNEPDELSQSLDLRKSISNIEQSEIKRRVSFGSYGSIKLDDLDKFIEFN